jgi:YVTN family beta-propeller protein
MRKALLALALLFPLATQAAETLLVLNKAESTLMFVDPATLKVVATIAVGDAPHEVQVAQGGRVAIVTNYGTGPNPGSTISIVDPSVRREVRRLQVPVLRPHGLYAVGQHLYITAEGSRVVMRYNIRKSSVDMYLGTGAETSHMVVVTPDEKKIYTANIGSDSISVLDLSGAPQKVGLKQIPVGKGPEGIDLSPDGKQLWTSHRADGKLSIIDTATDQVIKTLTIGTKMANRVKFTLDGKYALVSDPPSSEVLVLDAATGDVVKHIKTLAGPEGILIAPDGKRAFVACSEANKVQVIELEKLEASWAIEVGKGPDGLAWATESLVPPPATDH